MSIILGIIIMIAGGAITLKSEAVYSFFGPIAFFEKYLGTEGGSRLGYKLSGILFFVIGLLMATNLIGSLMTWILSPLIRAMGGTV